MSGWMKTSEIGIAATAIAPSGVRSSSIRLTRLARNAARNSVNSTFPNSDGWNWKKPTSIQRREPRVAAPAASTSSISPIVVAKISRLKRR